VVRPESKRAYLDVVAGLRQQGADGVILGCTEVGMLIGPDDVDLPVLDTARLHAEAAVDAALA
jgi:aspartate racemase